MSAPASRLCPAIAMVLCTSACAGGTAAVGDTTETVRAAHEREVVLVVAPELAAPAREAIRTNPAERVVDAAATATGAAARASDRLESARALYRDLRFEESLAAVSEAQLVLEADAAVPADFDALHQALLYRGMNELALGREDRAREALRQAARLRPHATLDAGRIPPDALALYEQMRTALRADPPAALAVTTEPAGARVTLDGEPVGSAPVSLNAPAGRHWVRVEAPGFAPRVLPVDLSAAGTPPLDVSLPPADAASTARDLAALDVAALRAISPDVRRTAARTLGADAFVRLTPLDDGDIEGIALDLATGRVRREVATATQVRADVARALGRLARRLVGPPEGATVAAPPPSGPSVFESPWLWIAVGVVAAAATTTAVVAATYEPTPVFRVRAQP